MSRNAQDEQGKAVDGRDDASPNSDSTNLIKRLKDNQPVNSVPQSSPEARMTAPTPDPWPAPDPTPYPSHPEPSPNPDDAPVHIVNLPPDTVPPGISVDTPERDR